MLADLLHLGSLGLLPRLVGMIDGDLSPVPRQQRRPEHHGGIHTLVEERLRQRTAPFSAHAFDQRENPPRAIALLEAGAELVEFFGEFRLRLWRLYAADDFPASSPVLCMRWLSSATHAKSFLKSSVVKLMPNSVIVR